LTSDSSACNVWNLGKTNSRDPFHNPAYSPATLLRLQRTGFCYDSAIRIIRRDICAILPTLRAIFPSSRISNSKTANNLAGMAFAAPLAVTRLKFLEARVLGRSPLRSPAYSPVSPFDSELLARFRSIAEARSCVNPTRNIVHFQSTPLDLSAHNQTKDRAHRRRLLAQSRR